MKYAYLSAAVLFAGLLLAQCKQPKYTAENLPDEFLRFGSGGGVTGAVTEYSLYKNGQVFKFAAKAPAPEEVASHGKKKAGQLFETAAALGLFEREFSHPGNLYYFLEFRNEGKQRRITWGDREHPVDPKIQDLYDQLTQLLPKRK